MVNALFASIPDVLNVAAVCFMFFLIFAILGVNYFKGILMSCQGPGYDALPEEVSLFMEEPIAWSGMSTEQQAWFGPLSNVSNSFSVDADGGGFTTASDCVAINSGWPDSGACCSEWPSSAATAPTSFEVSKPQSESTSVAITVFGSILMHNVGRPCQSVTQIRFTRG